METKNCQNCKKEFIIEPDDFGFYEKIGVPAPTFCPECRSQRRNAWRNKMSLYSDTCDSCGSGVISLYSPESGLTVYCNKCWWSDKWDPTSYGQEYDFSKPFFTQFRELIQKVPNISIVNDNGIASVNCEYTHDTWFAKNCYMMFSGWYIENIMYSFFVLAGKDMMDCMIIQSKNEWLYECMIARNCYQLKYSRHCMTCIDSQFLYDCRDCSNCFMCAGLRGKKFCFKNKQYSEEEYKKILESYRLDTFSGVSKAQKEFDEFILQYPRRCVDIIQSLNCTGDTISGSKNVKDCFVATKECENCAYSEFIGTDKDCYDVVMTGETALCYEGAIVDHSQMNLFGLFSVKSQDIRYTQHCHSSKHLFGCVGLRNANYCIFNKQYTKEEYEELVPKIIEHMNATPYVDKKGIPYKYGEYVPAELSLFGYNETFAQEQFPLSKEAALLEGYKWQDRLQMTVGKETITIENIPDSIHEINESILGEILGCIECGRNYKIVPDELRFYKKMSIPIPRHCFQCRHDARMRLRNPFKLWHRSCMCDKSGHNHEGNCLTEFETSYAPDRPEIIYCESCYQKEVV